MTTFELVSPYESLELVTREFQKTVKLDSKCVYCEKTEFQCFGHIAKMVLPFAIVDPLKVDHLNAQLAKICIVCGLMGAHEGGHVIQHAKFMVDIGDFKIFTPKHESTTMSPSDLVLNYHSIQDVVTPCLLSSIIVPPLFVFSAFPNNRQLLHHYNLIPNLTSSSEVFCTVSTIFNYLYKQQTEYIREHVHKRISEIYRAVIFCLDAEEDYGVVKISDWFAKRLYVSVYIRSEAEIERYYNEVKSNERERYLKQQYLKKKKQYLKKKKRYMNIDDDDDEEEGNMFVISKKEGLNEYTSEYSLKIGDVLYRNVRGGDTLIINRQPSLDIHSMVALTVKIDDTGTDYKSIGISPIVVKVLKGDFDGDAVAIMCPPEHLMPIVHEKMHVYNLKYCAPVQNSKVIHKLVNLEPDFNTQVEKRDYLRELSKREDQLIWDLLVQRSSENKNFNVSDMMQMFVDAKAKGTASDMREIFERVNDLNVLPYGICPYVELKGRDVVSCDRSYIDGMKMSFFIAHLMEQYLKLQSSSDKKVADTGYFTKKLVLLLSHLQVVNDDGQIETSKGDLVCERSSFKKGDAVGEMVATTLGAMLTQEFLESKRSDRGNIMESEKLLKKITHMLSLSRKSDGELIITNVTDIDIFKNKYMCTLWSQYLKWISYECTPESRKKRSSKPIVARFEILKPNIPLELIQWNDVKVDGNIMECSIDCDERDVWNIIQDMLDSPVMGCMFIKEILSYSGTELHVSFDAKKFSYLKIRELVPDIHVIYWNNILRLMKMVPNRNFARESLTKFFNTYYTKKQNEEYISVLLNTIIPKSGTSFSGCGYNSTKRQNVTNYMTMCLFESIRKSMTRVIVHSRTPFVDSTLYTDLLCGWLDCKEQKVEYMECKNNNNNNDEEGVSSDEEEDENENFMFDENENEKENEDGNKSDDD